MRSDAFQEAVAGLVAKERGETLTALALLAPVAAVLAVHDGGVPWIALGVAACLVARHALTRHRVAVGLFGGNAAEAREILAHVSARRS